MAEKLHTIEELEVLTGWHYLSEDDIDKDERLTEDVYRERVLLPENLTKFNYVLYDYRINWLKENGYRITRANILNAQLTVKQSEATAE